MEKLFKIKKMVCINSLKNSMLNSLKIKKYVDFAISTNNIKFSKPHPEIYLKCLINLESMPSETLVLEDSYFGRIAVKEANCNLMPIKYLSDVTYVNIINFINKINLKNKTIENQSWEDPKLNILIPMAGAGSRFEKAGYTFPKPLIEIHGKTMIQWVIERLKIKVITFIVRAEHEKI